MKKILCGVALFSAFAGVAQTNPGDSVFYSEMIEGSGVNKALEIYNGNADSVDLSEYKILVSQNGNGWSDTVDLMGGMLAPGDVYVVANTGADSVILAEADMLNNPVCQFNGDDARGLIRDNGTSVVLLDVFGDPNNDPGSSWDVGSTAGATANNTLMRKPTSLSGDTSWIAQQGTDDASSQWIVFPTNTFSNIGMHAVNSSAAVGSIEFTTTMDTVELEILPSDLPSAFVQLFVVNGMDSTDMVTGVVVTPLGDTIVSPNLTVGIGVTADTFGIYELAIILSNGLTVIDMDTMYVNVIPPVVNELQNIAELRAAAQGSTTYVLAGNAVVTYNTMNNRNQRYIQDSSAAILLDDPMGVVDATVTNDEEIGLIVGTLSSFAGVLQFRPSTSPVALGQNWVIEPELVTIQDLTDNLDDYESELIRLEDNEITNASPTWTNDVNYNLTNGTDTMVLRTVFDDADYIGSPMPVANFNMTGIALEFNGVSQVCPRFQTDICEFLATNDITFTNQGNTYTFTADLNTEAEVTWTLPDGSTEVGNPVMFDIDSNGAYTISFDAVGECSDSSGTLDFDIQGISLSEQTPSYFVSTVASDFFVIDESVEVQETIIYDMLGNVILTNDGQNTISVSSLSQGLYISTITLSNGNTSRVQWLKQ